MTAGVVSDKWCVHLQLQRTCSVDQQWIEDSRVAVRHLAASSVRKLIIILPQNMQVVPSGAGEENSAQTNGAADGL